MSPALLAASIRRHVPFLTPAEQAEFGPSDAELLAVDRSYAIAKDSGVLFADADRRVLQRQLNEGGAS